MATISVVLATYNEEENLPSCLDSVKDLAKEIIIVDGGSKDKTVEIAKKYGARVKLTDNPAIFHINKQKGIDMATKDWVLQLDADEIVTPSLRDEIKDKILNIKYKDINGYWIPRKNWFLGRFLMKGGQYPDYTLRLYRRGKGRLPQKTVHEQAKVIGEVGYLTSPLLHYPYKNFYSYLLKWGRYTDLLASQIEEMLRSKSIVAKILYGFGYSLIKPIHWFLITYIRHKGFLDLWPGFVFSFFSALRFPVSYLKFIKIL
ncbi:MAG: glycosyltransferase family 2 protein [Candidatus Levybacteria bacterium]|nr:glycosyltransferase family 2 protein [Candidatus Levybacteria bacterium]